MFVAVSSGKEGYIYKSIARYLSKKLNGPTPICFPPPSKIIFIKKLSVSSSTFLFIYLFMSLQLQYPLSFECGDNNTVNEKEKGLRVSTEGRKNPSPISTLKKRYFSSLFSPSFPIFHHYLYQCMCQSMYEPSSMFSLNFIVYNVHVRCYFSHPILEDLSSFHFILIFNHLNECPHQFRRQGSVDPVLLSCYPVNVIKKDLNCQPKL